MSFEVIRSDGEHFPIDPENIMSQDHIEFVESFRAGSPLYDIAPRLPGLFVGHVIYRHEDSCKSGIKMTVHEDAPNCDCFTKCIGMVNMLN